MKAILLVTWFYGQAASSYHIPFDSTDACEVAKAGILGDVQRLKEEAKKSGSRIIPIVSAVCSAM